jgi:CspA family cold shock protein
MNFRDRPVTCTVCGKTFIFTVTEQRKLHESGQAVREPDSDEIVPPKTCPACRLRDPITGRWSGRVKWFSYQKGYGFIVKPDDDEIFFHRSQVIGEPLTSLEEGVQVTFEEVSTDRGVEARQVRVESP